MDSLPAGDDYMMVSRSIDEIVDQVHVVPESGDHVLVMSNGGFGGIHEKLQQNL